LGCFAFLMSVRDSAFDSPARKPELSRLHEHSGAQHVVQFYADHDAFVSNVSYVLRRALQAAESSIVIATETHLNALDSALSSDGVNLARLRESGNYTTLLANDVLPRFLENGWPNETKFRNLIGGQLRKSAANSASGFVFAFGEMVALLCAQNRPAAAVRLEELWNSLAAKQCFSLYCAYPLECLVAHPDFIFKICAEHSMTIPAETSIN
jgi:MEDS: MEthanogen/methylotroph, DcmR Sensory domain